MTPNRIGARVLTAETMNTMNTFEDPEHVKPTALSGVQVDDDLVRALIPAKSVVVLAVN